VRRGCSITLFVIGGWLLATVAIVGLMPEDQAVSRWAIVGVFAALAAPFLLAATWASPGKRWAELGLTLMVTAGIALTIVITMAAFFFDPAVKRFMPEPLPPFDFTSPAMIVSIVLMAGLGYLLRRWGMKRAGQEADGQP
jgi:cation transport ATPase